MQKKVSSRTEPRDAAVYGQPLFLIGHWENQFLTPASIFKVFNFTCVKPQELFSEKFYNKTKLSNHACSFKFYVCYLFYKGMLQNQVFHSNPLITTPSLYCERALIKLWVIISQFREDQQGQRAEVKGQRQKTGSKGRGRRGFGRQREVQSIPKVKTKILPNQAKV